jgi:DNA-binding response OmpR family regulator
MTLTGNVLIVEDDAGTREMIADFLATQGYYAVVAEDGLEALHVLRTVLRRSPGAPCLVLLDLAMPRLSGTEFRRAQLDDPVVAAVPIAVMSGLDDAEQRARTLGAVATLTKPLDIVAVLDVVRRYCTV